MANQCFQRLSVVGPHEDLVTLQKLIAMEFAFDPHWQSGSNKEITGLTDRVSESSFYISTPWKPAYDAIIAMSFKLPNVSFAYTFTEEFWHFAGALMLKAGIPVKEPITIDIEARIFSKNLAPSNDDLEMQEFLNAIDEIQNELDGAATLFLDETKNSLPTS